VTAAQKSPKPLAAYAIYLDAIRGLESVVKAQVRHTGSSPNSLRLQNHLGDRTDGGFDPDDVDW